MTDGLRVTVIRAPEHSGLGGLGSSVQVAASPDQPGYEAAITSAFGVTVNQLNPGDVVIIKVIGENSGREPHW